jgi:hypothetical protein
MMQRFLLSPWRLGLLPLLLLSLIASCGVGPTDPATGRISQPLCSAGGSSGGDIGCGCTLNSQCSGGDNDTRLVICDVADGTSSGSCFDCPSSAARPIGCACSSSSDCQSGLACNGRSCQPLRTRGQFCLRDSDCGSDADGAMTCLPTKSWCGPLSASHYCDFNSDCLSGLCRAGLCHSGAVGEDCSKDSDCTAPIVCSTVSSKCVAKQPDGTPCTRNAECQNQCNSFSGVCQKGGAGVLCTSKNPDGDCASGFDCILCSGISSCRPTASPCT